MKKISIVIILPSLAGGGAENVTISFVENLNPKFFDYKVIIINKLGPLKINIEKDRIINLKGDRLRSSFIEMVKKIKLLKPDIILSTFPHITLPLLLVKKIFFLKTLIIAREPNMVNFSLNHSSSSIILKLLYKILMPSANKVIVNSKAMYNDLYNRKINQEKLFLIQNPVDHLDIRKLNNFHRYPGKGLRLVSVGRLVYQKGFDRVIPMLEDIKNVHLTLIGEGQDYNKLLIIAKNYNVRDKISFEGYIKKPYSYVAAADYFILPSRWEGLPNSVLESLVLGTPVISFNEVVGLKDIIKNSEKNSIMLCQNDIDMRLLLKTLSVRKDHKNLSLRKNLLKKFNTPKDYAEKISCIIKEDFSEKKN